MLKAGTDALTHPEHRLRIPVCLGGDSVSILMTSWAVFGVGALCMIAFILIGIYLALSRGNIGD